MTPNDIRIAIAELIGYRWYWVVSGYASFITCEFAWSLVLAYPPESGIGVQWKDMAGETRAATQDEIDKAKLSGDYTCHAPAFTESLDAMHLVELKGIDRSSDPCSWEYYLNQLETVCGTDDWPIMDESQRRSIVHATAAQKAEAFLRSKGVIT